MTTYEMVETTVEELIVEFCEETLGLPVTKRRPT